MKLGDSRFIRCAVVLLALILAGMALGPGFLHAQPGNVPVDLLDSVVGKSDLDLDQSYSMTVSTKEKSPSIPGNLRTIMGISRENNSDYDARWIGGTVRGETVKSDVFHYVISFKTGVNPGAMIFAGTPQAVSILKPEAPSPGDPCKDEQWLPVPIPGSQGESKFGPVPAGTHPDEGQAGAGAHAPGGHGRGPHSPGL